MRQSTPPIEKIGPKNNFLQLLEGGESRKCWKTKLEPTHSQARKQNTNVCAYIQRDVDDIET